MPNETSLFLEKTLGILPGDILISETPFEDAIEDDIFPFGSLNQFKATHVALWVGGENPVCHAVTEGYKLPGLRLSKLPYGKIAIYRYDTQPEIALNAAKIMARWANVSREFSKKDYLEAFPPKHWPERSNLDLNNFFQNSNNTVKGAATPYLNQRALVDLSCRARDNDLLKFDDEAIRRAIKFSSRRELDSEGVSKGQRCTPILVAAYQAAILAPIVKASQYKEPFKQFKNKPFLKYADDVLCEGWRETKTGALLASNPSKLFAAPFTVNQRYVVPNDLFKTVLSDNNNFSLVGRLSFFSKRLEVIHPNNRLEVFKSRLTAPTPSPENYFKENALKKDEDLSPAFANKKQEFKPIQRA